MKKNKSRSKNLNSILFLAILVLVLTAIPLYLLYGETPNKPDLVQTMDYDFNVTLDPGFVLDHDILHFGSIPYGNYANRSINLTTNEDYLVKIYHKGDGNLIVAENDFLLEKDTLKQISFLMYPTNKTIGKYNGTIYFNFYKVK